METPKRDSLPGYCRQCEVRFACNGECPRNRFLLTPDGEEGLNYLCARLKAFFRHIDRCMKMTANLLHSGTDAADVMQLNNSFESGKKYAKLSSLTFRI